MWNTLHYILRNKLSWYVYNEQEKQLVNDIFPLSEANEDGCTEGLVRLVNSTSENEGRVETCYHGRWGPVCSIGQTGAYVVCRSLGYDAGECVQ